MKKQKLTYQAKSPSPAKIFQLPTVNTKTTITDGIRADWKTYKKSGLTIKYPPNLIVEELRPYIGQKTVPNNLLAVKFYSAEADPNALMPQDQEEASGFVERYALIYLHIYANPDDTPLKGFLKQLYSQESVVPERTVFDLMESNIQTNRNDSHRSLIFVGNKGGNEQKQIFFLHNNKVYVLSLNGGAGGTGSKYSSYAEKIFDLMLTTLHFY